MKSYTKLMLVYTLFSLGVTVFIAGCSFVTLDVDLHVSQRSLLTKGNDDKVSLQRGDDMKSKKKEESTSLKIPLGGRE